jgi:hypothetical protein
VEIEDLAKAGDTIAALLTHPDPVERALALTLAHVEPKHISIAEKDPHPRVQAAVARWKLKHTPPERLDGFTVTHGQANDRHGPARMMYFHASPEQSEAMGVHGHGFTQYARKRFQRFGHFAPDILGYVRYTGAPENGKVVVHDVHAPWHLSPAVRGVHVGSWLNRTFSIDHDLGSIEGEGQSQISDLSHHGVEHKIFGGQEPERVLHDSFARYMQTKGAKEVAYDERPFEHPEDLRKDIGYVTLPKFGINTVPSKAMIVSNPRDVHARVRQQFGGGKHSNDPEAVSSLANRMVVHGSGFQASNARLDAPTPWDRRFQRVIAVPGGPNAEVHRDVRGTALHESQHAVFGKLGHEYGQRVRRAVAEHLISKLSKDEKDTLNQMMQPSGYDWYQHPEEGITTHQNYLTDPKWREHVHSTLGLDSIRARHMHNTLKRTWKKLRAHATLLTPAEIIG